jgi:phage/plasmid-associated DNA primase
MKFPNLGLTNRDICELFVDTFDMSNLVCINEEKKLFYAFDETDAVWKKKSSSSVTELMYVTLTPALKKLRKRAFEKAIESQGSKKKKYLEYGEMCEKVQERLKATVFMRHTVECFVSQCFDDTFEGKLNHQTHTLQFRNGRYDLKEGTFSSRTKEDYVSITLDYDYTSTVDEAKVKYLEEVIRRTCNDNEVCFNSMLKWLGYCITGEVCESKFMCHIGYTASNGKTTICKILEAVFPIYVASMRREAFSVTQNANAHKDLAKLKDKPIRFVYVEEIDKDKLNIALIKDIAGGNDKLENQVMHSTTTTLKVQMKLNLLSNKDLVFDTDEGMKRRGFMMVYKNKFVSKDDLPRDKPGFYSTDPTLMAKLATLDFKLALLHILLPFSKHYYDNGLKLDASFTSAYTSLCSDNDEMGDFLDTRVEITNNPEDRIGKDDFTDAYNLHMKKNLRFIHLLSHIKRFNLEYNKGVRANGNRGCVVGVKWIPAETSVEFVDEPQESGLDEGVEIPNQLVSAISKVAEVKVDELPPALQKKFKKHQASKQTVDEDASDMDLVSLSVSFD